MEMIEAVPGPSSRLEPIPALPPPLTVAMVRPPPFPFRLGHYSPYPKRVFDPSLHITKADRIVLIAWLVILLITLIALMSFYTWTFFTVGVASATMWVGYWFLWVISGILFIFFILALIGLCVTRVGDEPWAIMSYNCAVGVVLLFDMAMMLMFHQSVDESEVLQFISKDRPGTRTFVNYIHSRFNCCITYTEEVLASSKWGYQMRKTGTTMSPEGLAEAYNLCPQDGLHDKKCFEMNETLYDLLIQNEETYKMYLLQAYLPSVLFLFVVILMFFICVITCGASAWEKEEARGATVTPTPVISKTVRFDENSLASVVCSGFARYSGIRAPRSVIPLPSGRSRTRSRPGPTLGTALAFRSTLFPCTREVIPMRELQPRDATRRVTLADVMVHHQGHQNSSYQETENL